jgi:hypothetical protein
MAVVGKRRRSVSDAILCGMCFKAYIRGLETRKLGWNRPTAERGASV